MEHQTVKLQSNHAVAPPPVLSVGKPKAVLQLGKRSIGVGLNDLHGYCKWGEAGEEFVCSMVGANLDFSTRERTGRNQPIGKARAREGLPKRGKNNSKSSSSTK